MKISTRGRYGLRIMLDLASQKDDNSRLIKDISSSQQISSKYISQLIIDLRHAGLISSVRGAKGGLKLVKSPSEITLLDIIEATEGTISIIDCVKNPNACPRAEQCQAATVWTKLNSGICDLMRKITLEEIINGNQHNLACECE